MKSSLHEKNPYTADMIIMIAITSYSPGSGAGGRRKHSRWEVSVFFSAPHCHVALTAA